MLPVPKPKASGGQCLFKGRLRCLLPCQLGNRLVTGFLFPLAGWLVGGFAAGFWWMKELSPLPTTGDVRPRQETPFFVAGWVCHYVLSS